MRVSGESGFGTRAPRQVKSSETVLLRKPLGWLEGPTFNKVAQDFWGSSGGSGTSVMWPLWRWPTRREVQLRP